MADRGDIPGLGSGTRGGTEGAERQGVLIMVTLSFARTPSLSRQRTEGLGTPVPSGPHPCPALHPPLPTPHSPFQETSQQTNFLGKAKAPFSCFFNIPPVQ